MLLYDITFGKAEILETIQNNSRKSTLHHPSATVPIRLLPKHALSNGPNPSIDGAIDPQQGLDVLPESRNVDASAA
jgi:hypothetical protein